MGPIVFPNQASFVILIIIDVSLSKDLKIFCPGIRDVKATKHDQKRTKSYSEFCHMSKNDSKVYCVIGRPIYENGDAGQNIKKIIQSAN